MPNFANAIRIHLQRDQRLSADEPLSRLARDRGKDRARCAARWCIALISPAPVPRFARFVLSAKGQALLAWARRWPWVLPVATTIVVTVAPQIYWCNATYWNSAPMVVAFKSLVAITYGMVLLSACALQYKMVVRLSAPLRYLGTISYGIFSKGASQSPGVGT
jgi:hypothetical protein